MTQKTNLIFILFFLQTLVFSQTNKSVPTTVRQLAGTWSHSKDSLATVHVKDKTWTFLYNDTSQKDIFQLSIKQTLPKYADPKVKADFLVLTNKSDTMYFEILGVTKNSLSLMHFPTGRLHLYKK